MFGHSPIGLSFVDTNGLAACNLLDTTCVTTTFELSVEVLLQNLISDGVGHKATGHNEYVCIVVLTSQFGNFRTPAKSCTDTLVLVECHEAAGNIIADIAHKDGSLKASKRGSLKTALQSAPESALQTALETALESALQTAPKSALKIIEQISNNPRATMTDLANLTGYSRRWVAQTIKRLQEQNIIKRIGSDKSGYWEIIGK